MHIAPILITLALLGGPHLAPTAEAHASSRVCPNCASASAFGVDENGASIWVPTVVDVQTDGWGRPTQYRVPGRPDRTMTWDAEGPLLTLQTAGEASASHDADNWRDQRISRETLDEVVTSLWEGDGVLAEAVTHDGDTAVRSHLRGAGMVLAVGETRLGQEWLGSPVMYGSAGGGFKTRRFDASASSSEVLLGKGEIEMYVNKDTEVIETAYPKF